MVLHFYFVITLDLMLMGTTKTYQFTCNLLENLTVVIYNRNV